MNKTFELIKKEMDIAMDKKSLAHFHTAAERLGLIENNIGSLFSVRYQYTLFLPTGGKVSGTMRSYDQSGPFQNLPDMNKIEMQLMHDSKVLEEYGVSWED